MDIVKTWTDIVFKILNQGFKKLNEKENKFLDIYYRWKVKKILPDEQVGAIISGKREIIDDLKGEMFLFMKAKHKEFEDLKPEELWNKFNNHSLRFLRYKYIEKLARESRFQIGGSERIPNYPMEGKQQDNMPEEQLDERYVFLSQLAFEQIPNYTNIIIEKEKEKAKEIEQKHGLVEIITFNEKGEVEKIERFDPKKRKK